MLNISSVLGNGITKRHLRQALYPQGAPHFPRETGYLNAVTSNNKRKHDPSAR